MSDYIISCSSPCDLTAEHLAERNIHCSFFHFELGEKQYEDDLGKSISYEDFYKAMEDGAMTKTSQPNSDELANSMRPFLEEGKDILYLCLSSGLSGTINSANIAKDILEEEFPDRKIYIVDSLAASSGYGLFVDKLADLRDEGMSIDELYDWAVNNRLKLAHWFFTSDLTFFVRGGRVSKTSGFVGGILGICPLLNVNFEGKLTPRSKIRTKAKVIQEIVKRMEETADDRYDYSGKCYISHSACYEDARQVADLVEEKFPKLNGKVLINNIGTTIGSHTGPGTVALFFWADERVN